MESNFNNRDFEQFVKQNADQYRMFPSEKVWSGIYSTLHTRRKWYGFGLAFLILTIASVTWVMLNPSDKKQIPSVEPTIASEINTLVSRNSQKEIIDIASAKPTTNSSPFVSGINNWQKNGVSNETNLTIINPILRNQLIVENFVAEKEMESHKVIISSNARGSELTNTSYNFINTESLIDDNLSYYTDRNKENLDVNNLTVINDVYPLSIENVINSFNAPHNRKKWLWQVYFTPTISYRKLVDNKTSIISSQSSPLNYSIIYGVNSAVTHKPDMGFELGFSTSYPISNKIRITSGLQFNVSKYDIWAYNHSTEFATVALRNGGGTNSSVSTTTNYRNFDGYKPNWLHNLYLSASLPIGVELKLSSSSSKNYIGIGGTMQPTYILGDRAYLISTDYKNYVEIPQLIRKLNVNTSFEAFASYSTGRINWKVGPQVRYQLLSSFRNKYPIKEHLFDFGLKVGIMINK